MVSRPFLSLRYGPFAMIITPYTRLRTVFTADTAPPAKPRHQDVVPTEGYSQLHAVTSGAATLTPHWWVPSLQRFVPAPADKQTLSAGGGFAAFPVRGSHCFVGVTALGASAPANPPTADDGLTLDLALSRQSGF